VHCESPENPVHETEFLSNPIIIFSYLTQYLRTCNFSRNFRIGRSGQMPVSTCLQYSTLDRTFVFGNSTTCAFAPLPGIRLSSVRPNRLTILLCSVLLLLSTVFKYSINVLLSAVFKYSINVLLSAVFKYSINVL